MLSLSTTFITIETKHITQIKLQGIVCSEARLFCSVPVAAGRTCVVSMHPNDSVTLRTRLFVATIQHLQKYLRSSLLEWISHYLLWLRIAFSINLKEYKDSIPGRVKADQKILYSYSQLPGVTFSTIEAT